MVDKKIQVGFFFLVFGLTILLSFLIFKPYMNILVLSGTFAIIFYPLYQYLLKKLRNKLERLASLLSVVAVLVIVLIPLVFLTTRLASEAQSFYDKVKSGEVEARVVIDLPYSDTNVTINKWEQSMNQFITAKTLSADEYIQKGVSLLQANAQKIFQSAAGTIFAFFIWALSLYYFFKDGRKIKRLIVGASPLDDKYDNEIISRLRRAVKSVIGGTLLVAILQGILVGVGFTIFGVPAAFVWGAVAIITALIPNIGTAMITAPGVIYLLFTNQVGMAIGLAIWAAVIVGLADNFLRPFLIEKGIHIHPLVILLSVLGGIAFFGPVGFITGPLVIALLVEFGKIYRQFILKEAK
ncbi:MAG: hypothetical protein COU09_01940 [Candidatus Harrisonbacteria bacterium CG10_big_fil_rev_8_21_14_0_10_44_23]|uniref:AI-2E family transporter n=1 Tax=Candidatus Harrisonbacteria bacterium CG10_big_fil_rev_8_21_14_0_10_44_23 TaxID=1974585 RepID=A0A2H0URT9_9BACT|nr:MAG: hypothetical protein COU09_01940 [Candidatus Harrisonbacteria bacterium CG10_big_fil_rev_8_21_14_0_10_44_23]